MNSCPVTTLKLHSAGDKFGAIFVAGKFQLKRKSGFVLIGYRGNPYNFATEKNANTWLCTNLSRFNNAEENTSLKHMVKLSKIYSLTREQYIINEIEAIQGFERGEWTITECGYEVQITDFNVDGGNAFTTY